MTALKRPLKGDKAMLARVVGRFHVGTPDAEIEAAINARIDNALLAGHTMTAAVRKAWVAEALKAHKRNRNLALFVARGGR